MKKFIGFIICFIFCFIFLVSCGDETENNSERLIDSARNIKIVQIDGSATVSDDSDTLECFKGMNLYDGDSVVVSANSTLVIKFDEDKYVYLGENTKINIKSEGENKYKTNVFVEMGKVLAEIQNQLGQDEEFFLSSNNSVMAVRGTVFGVSVKKIAQKIIQKYSIYRGVTELYVFDTDKSGGLISGKIMDIQNSQYEIVIPESEVLDNNNDYNQSVNNWLKDVNKNFDDSEGANKELDEVQITVDEVSKEEYQEIIDKIDSVGGSNVTYSNINYIAHGYYGVYDGLPHSMSIDLETKGAKIYYKASENGEYSENIPTFTEPGYYRTYYKITCDGYSDKEDYGVVQIYKGDLEIEYKDNLVIPGLIQGMSLENALANIDLSDYIAVKGADKDKDLLSKTTYSVSGNLENGTNTYDVEIILDDNIKSYYEIKHAEIILTAYELVLDSTYLIDGGYLDIDYASDFNKYNGVSTDELFANPIFTAGSNTLVPSNVTFNYDYKTEGYYELSNGQNIVEVKLDFDNYSITSDVNFYFYDNRAFESYDIEVDEITVSTLAEDSYYFNTNDINVENNNYVMTTYYLASHLGLSDFPGYINLPNDVIDSNSDNYLVNNTNNILLPVDSTTDIELLIFPNSSSRGMRKIISIYFSMTPPTDFPTYTIKNSLSYYPGSNFDFVISDSPVAYSLDGVNYHANLSIDELGQHIVYFKVGDTVITKGSRTLLITTGGIESDGLDLISSQIYILSTDGVNTNYIFTDGTYDNDQDREVVSEDGTAISPIDDIYEIYTNIIKNATYYNDLTHEQINVEVNITRASDNSPNFSYEVMSEGYASLRGSVSFNYIYEGTPMGKEPGQILQPTLEFELKAANPADLTVSLSDVDRVYASRTVFSAEEIGGEYEVLYSSDEGKTWVDESPEFTEVGQYKVYAIYRNDFSDYEVEDILIVSIQNITITE